MAYIGKSPSGTGVRIRYYFTQSSGGATSISGTDDNNKTLSFSDGEYVDVYLNGVSLVAGTDYNTTTANTIGGLSALANGDVVEVVVYDIFTVADTVSQSSGGTFSGAVSFSGGITGDLTVDTSTLHVDSTNNRVGIGTASPSSAALHIDSGSDNANTLMLSDGAADGNIVDGFVTCRHHSVSEEPVLMIQGRSTSSENIVLIGGTHNNSTYNTATSIKFFTASGYTNTTPVEKMRVTGDGLTFNGDTAAANALSDYEEGSFTPTLTFGGGSSGMTFSSQVGRYTKIGNMCTVYVEMNLSNKGSSTGSVLYGGLPFTAASDIQDRAVTLQMFRNVPSGSDNLAHLFHVFPQNSQNNCILRSTISTGDAGPDDSDYDNDTKVSFTLTYKTA